MYKHQGFGSNKKMVPCTDFIISLVEYVMNKLWLDQKILLHPSYRDYNDLKLSKTIFSSFMCLSFKKALKILKINVRGDLAVKAEGPQQKKGILQTFKI